MAADNPTSGTDTHVETVEKPQAADRPSSPPPDKPGAEGTPSRADSRAATTAARETPRETGAEQRGEREDKPAPQAPAESAGEKRDTATASKPETEGTEQRDAPSKEGRTSEGSSQRTDSSVSDSRGEHDRPATPSETREPDTQRPQAETSTADQKRATEVEDRGRSGDQEPARATADDSSLVELSRPTADQSIPASWESGERRFADDRPSSTQQGPTNDRWPAEREDQADGGQEPQRPDDSGLPAPSPETRASGERAKKDEGDAEPPESRAEATGESGSIPPDRIREGERNLAKTEKEESLPDQIPSEGQVRSTDESDARPRSRENAQGSGTVNEQAPEIGRSEAGSGKLEQESVKETIDPFVPDRSKAEGRKEEFQRTVTEGEANWTEGVDRVDDLPTGEALAEKDDGRARRDRFRKTTYEKFDTIKDQVEGVTKTVERAFGPRPSGHSETRVQDGPVTAAPLQSGIDAGSAASSLLAAGIVGAEMVRWARGKVRRGT